MNEPASRLVAVSNRLPVSLARGPEGWSVKPGSGGLVTALSPILKSRGGLWIGWSGGTKDVDAELGDLLRDASRQAGFRLLHVSLSEDQIRDYYHGFSNEIIWPLFHDLQTRCNFKPDYWYQYLKVNRKFAEVTASRTHEADYVWVHDYHLMNLADSFRGMGVRRKTGFFLHIPFPPLDIFKKLPWRQQILKALLEFDLVGFQTLNDRSHFIQSLRQLLPGVEAIGRGYLITVRYGERSVKVGTFPIGIDYSSFARQASSKEVSETAWYIHENLPERKVILGIDRLDYTKGITERLEAFRNALQRFPEMREKVTLVQVVVPSREDVPEYQSLKAEIERLVSEINGEFTVSGWVPIHYLYRSLDSRELFAYYRLSEIALITPLKDGMNLVAKEYCACNNEKNGVLILSEFAGAAAQLGRAAIMVNPYDIEGVSSAIYRAYKMSPEERRTRMILLRKMVRSKDVFWWVNSFLKAASFPDRDSWDRA